ncbi:MAG: 30S ribosomal protein S1, partial [Syntrophobacteraceae bacterium]|nr:30S ribosomal protein S1 [Syntrophobacteraceae bacterium]
MVDNGKELKDEMTEDVGTEGMMDETGFEGDMEDMGSMQDLYDQSFQNIQEGEVIQGRIVQ